MLKCLCEFHCLMLQWKRSINICIKRANSLCVCASNHRKSFPRGRHFLPSCLLLLSSDNIHCSEIYCYTSLQSFLKNKPGASPGCAGSQRSPQGAKSSTSATQERLLPWPLPSPYLNQASKPFDQNATERLLGHRNPKFWKTALSILLQTNEDSHIHRQDRLCCY